MISKQTYRGQTISNISQTLPKTAVILTTHKRRAMVDRDRPSSSMYIHTTTIQNENKPQKERQHLTHNNNKNNKPNFDDDT
jgi:hypothetical protein